MIPYLLTDRTDYRDAIASKKLPHGNSHHERTKSTDNRCYRIQKKQSQVQVAILSLQNCSYNIYTIFMVNQYSSITKLSSSSF